MGGLVFKEDLKKEGVMIKGSLGERIREERKKRGINSLEELAKKTGISISHLSDIERGKTDVSGEKLLKIARVLRCSTDYLLTGESPKPEIEFDLEEFIKKHKEILLKEVAPKFQTDPKVKEFCNWLFSVEPKIRERFFKLAYILKEEDKEKPE